MATLLLVAAGHAAAQQGHAEHQHGLSPTVPPVGLSLLLLTGLLTGLTHCIGMCGPLVSTFSVARRKTGRGDVLPLLFYQLGRLTTYGLIGALVGTVGKLVLLTAGGQGLQAGLAIFFGLLMIVAGLALAGLLPRWHQIESARLAGWAGERIGTLLQAEHPAAPFALGMTNGLLPCGPVYAMALAAAAAGSALHGASIMLLFGLGTVAPLLSVGFLFTRMSVTLRARIFRYGALLIAVVGLQLVLRGLALIGLIPHFHVGAVMLW